MAIPTVRYDRIAPASNSSLISEFMPRLQAVMFDAGWEIVYADAIAIGGGTGSVPAWDATPVASTSAGVAIYRMPANGFTRQWYAQVELSWGSTVASNHNFIVTIGTGWDAVSALTGAGDTFTWLANATSTGLEVLMSASEDGFAWHYATANAGSNRWVIVERARDFAGTVGEDLIVTGAANAGTFVDQSATYGAVRYRASDGYQYPTSRHGGLTFANSQTAVLAFGALTMSFTAADGESGLAMGPFCFSGIPSGLPRLLLWMAIPDAVTGTNHPVYVDGSVRQYRTPLSLLTNAPAILIATE
jgi:hypothetical protein